MEKTIEEVLNRLVDVEEAASQMKEAVEAQKKELAAEMEEKKQQFDEMLKLESAQKTEALKERMEKEKEEELDSLLQTTTEELYSLQHKYDTEHDRISDEIVKSIIRM